MENMVIRRIASHEVESAMALALEVRYVRKGLYADQDR